MDVAAARVREPVELDRIDATEGVRGGRPRSVTSI